MAMFNSYVSLPEGSVSLFRCFLCANDHSGWCPPVLGWMIVPLYLVREISPMYKPNSSLKAMSTNLANDIFFPIRHTPG